MKHNIKIYKGEQFTIDKVLVNKDGTPYIIPKLDNPYFLLSISDREYSMTGRVIRNYWLPITKTFVHNIPIESTKIVNFGDITGFPCDVRFTDEPEAMYTLEADDFVYKVDDRYVYWDVDDNCWKNYECNVACTFLSTDTSKLDVKSYIYTIQLVAGISNREYLKSLYNGADADDYSNKELYDKLVSSGVKFASDYDVEQELGVIEYSIPILEPNALEVINYMQGGII